MNDASEAVVSPADDRDRAVHVPAASTLDRRNRAVSARLAGDRR
jgi:hypothetical protein